MRLSHIIKRLLLITSAVLLVLLLAYLFLTAKEIERESTIDDAQTADVIIVLGAAEYRGKPSPVLQGRLNHALLLYLKGLAPYILTTGGAGGDPEFTEAEVGRGYLTEHGVPSEAILVEPGGSTTGQSLTVAAEIMRRMNFQSCIVVSDGYHIFRARRMLQFKGLHVYGSPRPSPGLATPGELKWLYFRQAVGWALFRIGINI
jgi:uncharacterized SAM-binding protein YcdF (DUF218 family)